jgi:hypothetical protein
MPSSDAHLCKISWIANAWLEEDRDQTAPAGRQLGRGRQRGGQRPS